MEVPGRKPGLIRDQTSDECLVYILCSHFFKGLFVYSNKFLQII